MTSGPSPIEARPRVLPSQTGRISTTFGTAFVTMTRDPDGQPFEVFLNVGKAGSETFASAEALGRLISLALRLNSPISRSERLQGIVSQLEHIGSLANDASLPSIPDALAKVLLEFSVEGTPAEPLQPTLSRADSDEQLQQNSNETVSEEAFKPLSPREVITAQKPQRNLPAITLSKERNQQKQPMNTLYSLPDEILTATEQLAAAVLLAGPVAAYQQAKARLDGDAQARELLESFLKTQSDLRVCQSRNAVTQSDVDALRALQRQVQSNQVILEYARTQQAAVAFLPDVNQEISQLLGVDFASLAGQSSC